MNESLFMRVGVGLVMALLAITMGMLTLDTIKDLLAGRGLDHPVPRLLVALLFVFSSVLAIRLIVRTLLRIGLTRTGKKARATIIAVETRDNARWKNSYRFHDEHGEPREASFVTQRLEFMVGDEGEVYYSDGWAGSRWMSESIHDDLPQPPLPSASKGLSKMTGFLIVASLLMATGGILWAGPWVVDVIEYHGLLAGGAIVGGLWLMIAAFTLPVLAIVAFLVGPFIAVAYVIAREAFGD